MKQDAVQLAVLRLLASYVCWFRNCTFVPRDARLSQSMAAKSVEGSVFYTYYRDSCVVSAVIGTICSREHHL